MKTFWTDVDRFNNYTSNCFESLSYKWYIYGLFLKNQTIKSEGNIMLFKFSNILKMLLVMLTAGALLTGCGDKNGKDGEGSKSGNSGSGSNADLVTKDSVGTKASLVMKPQKGDVFRYKMKAITNSKEKSPMTKDTEISSTQDIDYYFSEEVSEVASTGIITYKIIFDSINIVSSMESGDSSVSFTYNSNIKDSIYSKPDFIQYNSIMNEEFFARVSPLGEVSEIYGLERVYENMYKALGDTLDDAQKESLRTSFGKEAIQAVLQQQFQIFPENAVYKDSSWTRSYDTQIMVFPVKNILSYKLIDLQNANKDNIVKIEADLAVEFTNKEVKDERMSYKVEEEKTGGKGTIEFNLSKGCLVSKQTGTNIDLSLKLSAGGQSVNTQHKVETKLNISLLQ